MRNPKDDPSYYFLLSREELFEIGVKEKVLTLLDKYKAVAKLFQKDKSRTEKRYVIVNE